MKGFVRLWERIRKTLGGEFVRIHETLGEDSQGIDEDFGRGFARICETLGEDS